MSFQIDQSLSLMIPRVFPQWIDEEKIVDIFHQQNIGRVYKVSIIRMPYSKKRGYPIYQAYVYFSAWYDNEIAYHFQQRIFGPRAQARVVYDDPWYWVVFENTKNRLSNNDKRMIRLGYQAYLNEQAIFAQEQRLRQLEYKQMAEPLQFWASDPVSVPSEPYLNWNRLSEEFAMNTLGAELNLTETAMSVAETALAEDDEEMSNEMDLTETAMNVAETALTEDHEEMSAEMDLTETAMSVAEAALAEEDTEMYCCSACQFDHDDREYDLRDYIY
jgi:hypothetical protein